MDGIDLEEDDWAGVSTEVCAVRMALTAKRAAKGNPMRRASKVWLRKFCWSFIGHSLAAFAEPHLDITIPSFLICFEPKLPPARFQFL